MRIFITRETGTTFIVKVNPSDTIFSVKVKVAERKHIPVRSQHLFLADVRLENSRTVEHYNIQPGTKLQLRNLPMQILVQSKGKRFVRIASDT